MLARASWRGATIMVRCDFCMLQQARRPTSVIPGAAQRARMRVMRCRPGTQDHGDSFLALVFLVPALASFGRSAGMTGKKARAPHFSVIQGIARRMLDEMFALGKLLGCEEAWVGTELDNEPARGLYRARKPGTEEPFVMYVYDL